MKKDTNTKLFTKEIMKERLKEIFKEISNMKGTNTHLYVMFHLGSIFMPIILFFIKSEYNTISISLTMSYYVILLILMGCLFFKELNLTIFPLKKSYDVYVFISYIVYCRLLIKGIKNII